MVCRLHCTQSQNLFREQNKSLLWLVLSPYKISVCGCQSLMRLFENTWSSYIFSVPLMENISGWKLNWRKGKMVSWAEHWLKTQRTLETRVNDLDFKASIMSCCMLTLWIWTCPMNTPWFVTQPPYKPNSTSQGCCKALVSGICKALGIFNQGQL